MKRRLTRLAGSRLCRAYVCLPISMCERDRPFQERVVFFEVPYGIKYEPYDHLQQLLAATWQIDTRDWSEKGWIYNLRNAYEIADEVDAAERDSLLPLLECAWGKGGVGPNQDKHYSRLADIDLFVSPRLHRELMAALLEAEALYAKPSVPA